VTLAALAFYEEPRTVTLCMAQDYVEPADLASRMPNTFTNHLNYYGILRHDSRTATSDKQQARAPALEPAGAQGGRWLKALCTGMCERS
jgi:hypothetical protein